MAKLRGIAITPPKFGVSKGDYFFNKDKNIIAKGLTSVKYMSKKVADELYELSQSRQYNCFSDLLYDIENHTDLDARQRDILIKIDFFSDFGNQRELFAIVDIFDKFKQGSAKQIKKDIVDGTHFEEAVKKYSIGTTKSGKEAKSYTILDPMGIVRELETQVLNVGMEDLGLILKNENFKEVMGYYGYASGKDTDRAKLFIKSVFGLHRKKDGKLFGYSVITQSLGNGKESRMTVFKNRYDRDPIKEHDVILCKRWERDGKYFQLLDYEHLY